MEDWEQFFVDKSRRRAEVERRERQRGRALRWASALTIIALIVAGLVALGLTR